MSAEWLVDTNILVYQRDSADPRKQAIATAWLKELAALRLMRVSTQVLNEYYVTVTRKLKPGLAVADARRDVDRLAALFPVIVDEAVIRSAWKFEDRFKISWWDALIVAAADSGGCSYLLSEDMQDGQTMGSVTIVNPFEHEVSEFVLD